MVDVNKYNEVLAFPFPKNRKELAVITSQEDGEFGLAFEYHVAKRVIKELGSSTVNSASERAALINQIKELESHIKFTGDNINSLSSKETPIKPLGMSVRNLTKIFGTMALISMECNEPHLAHDIVNNHYRNIEDKCISYGIETPIASENFIVHVLDAIELCTTDDIAEKFPPPNILRSYIYLFIRIIADQSTFKFYYGNRINVDALSKEIRTKIEHFMEEGIFQPIDNLSRLGQTLGNISKQF